MKEDGTAQGAAHYQQADVQPIEVMQKYLTPEQFIGLLRGNILKYTLRLGHKDDAVKDAQKAAQYASWLVDALAGKTIKPMGEKPAVHRLGSEDSYQALLDAIYTKDQMEKKSARDIADLLGAGLITPQQAKDQAINALAPELNPLIEAYKNGQMYEQHGQVFKPIGCQYLLHDCGIVCTVKTAEGREACLERKRIMKEREA